MRLDYDTELKSTAELMVTNIITVAPNVSVARMYFQPSVIGKEASGTHDTSLQYCMKGDVTTRKELCTKGHESIL